MQINSCVYKALLSSSKNLLPEKGLKGRSETSHWELVFDYVLKTDQADRTPTQIPPSLFTLYKMGCLELNVLSSWKDNPASKEKMTHVRIQGTIWDVGYQTQVVDVQGKHLTSCTISSACKPYFFIPSSVTSKKWPQTKLG